MACMHSAGRPYIKQRSKTERHKFKGPPWAIMHTKTGLEIKNKGGQALGCAFT
jgi:hypothetical protein